MADLLSDLLLPLHQQPAEAAHVVGVQSVPDILQREAKALKVLDPVDIMDLVIAIVAVAGLGIARYDVAKWRWSND